MELSLFRSLLEDMVQGSFAGIRSLTRIAQGVTPVQGPGFSSRPARVAMKAAAWAP